ncbi:uncharacterized protein DUF4440 [Marinoscillum furvescens DSM 4134]|uniref:Uncharacterized protein DUF4440 n=2 Tax=Marinoscillum furvescens TaxID=1026 RepID=A0A3D9KVR5_MARFU|nr:uncharacterized protein DUF4440 [Marinoscillum furvescens DSM 4134]
MVAVPAMAQEQEIRKILKEQEDCWNSGDITCFMQGYWKSDSLVFVGQSGVTYGWEATLQNYQKNYPGQEEMGTLTFDILEVRLLSKQSWLMIGKWSLWRKEPVFGHFSVVFQQKEGRWVIVADHSS